MIDRILFPTICIDNFYKNPDEIRDFALSLTYENDPTNSGRYPGKRTKPLHEIDKVFFNKFCEKIMSIYFDFSKSRVDWNIATAFQKIDMYHESRYDLRNSGWIHQDNEVLVSGVIYLNKSADLNSGTSIFKLKSGNKAKNCQTIKNKFYKSGLDENYDEEFLDHKNEFEETINYKNIYNRMISFDALQYHGVNSFYTGEEPRLTQVFFVYSVETDQKMPIQKIYEINDL